MISDEEHAIYRARHQSGLLTHTEWRNMGYSIQSGSEIQHYLRDTESGASVPLYSRLQVVHPYHGEVISSDERWGVKDQGESVPTI